MMMDDAVEINEHPDEEMEVRPQEDAEAKTKRHVRLPISIEIEPKPESSQSSANSPFHAKESPGDVPEENYFDATRKSWGERLDGFRSSMALRLQWIPDNFTATQLKPVVRSALCAWVSVVLLVIARVEDVMGQVSLSIHPAMFNG